MGPRKAPCGTPVNVNKAQAYNYNPNDTTIIPLTTTLTYVPWIKYLLIVMLRDISKIQENLQQFQVKLSVNLWSLLAVLQTTDNLAQISFVQAVIK